MNLFTDVESWVNVEKLVDAAILYGSTAREPGSEFGADHLSDIDLHIITKDPDNVVRINWKNAFPNQKFLLMGKRVSQSGVPKLTLVFESGCVDMMLLPAFQLWLGRVALGFQLHHHSRRISDGLNSLATGLRSGFRFLKGGKSWEAFYVKVATEMPGIRLNDAEVRRLADVFLCDLFTVYRWLKRGELAATQHAIHDRLAATNFSLMRELHLRKGVPLPSFELARRLEEVLPLDAANKLSIDSRLQASALGRATWHALDGLVSLMHELSPTWKVPEGVRHILMRYASERNEVPQQFG